jgi:hypothetical protein
MRHICLVMCCLALSVATAHAAVNASSTPNSKGQGRHPPSKAPVFKVSAFKDVTAYVLTNVQQELKGELTAQQGAIETRLCKDPADSMCAWGFSAIASRSKASSLLHLPSCMLYGVCIGPGCQDEPLHYLAPSFVSSRVLAASPASRLASPVHTCSFLV